MTKKPSVVNLNDLFGIEENLKTDDVDNKGITQLRITDLVPFKNHPFKLYEGNRLDDMVASIKEHGIIIPLIVRPIENNKYEILSGHNRANAGKIAGLEKAPVVIKEGLTDEEAMLIVTETNLIQRSFSELSHSEKARILTERHNAMKEQGKRTDLGKGVSEEKQRKIDLINEIEMMSNIDGYGENLDFRQVGETYRSDVEIGKTYDLSPRNVSRYLRIDMLIDDLKTRLDNDNEIPFRAGVALSFLKEEEQKQVEQILKEGYKMDLKKADTLKTLSKGRNFTHEKAYEVLSGKYFNKPKKAKSFKFTNKFKKSINKYFKESQNQSEIEETIEKALEMYFSQYREKDNELEEDMEA